MSVKARNKSAKTNSKQHRTDFEIWPLFRDLLPPLQTDELTQLEANILADGGVNDAITLWRRTDGRRILVDGHNRRHLNEKLTRKGHQLRPLQFIEKTFANELEAATWIRANQNGRRNLTVAQLALAICENEPLVKAVSAEAKGRQHKGRLASADAKGKTDERLAAIAGVSPKSIERARKIIEVARQFNRPDLLIRIRNGEKLRTAFTSARNIERDQIRFERQMSKPTPISTKLSGAVNVIHHADVLDGIALIPNSAVALCMSSPPYPFASLAYDNPATDYKGYEDWLKLIRSAYSALFPKMRSGGRVVIQIDQVNNQFPKDQETICHRALPIYHDVCQLMFQIGYGYYGQWTWYKQNIVGRGRAVAGSDLSPSCPNIGRNDEYVLVFFKDKPELDGAADDIDMTQDDFDTCFPSQWYIPPVRRHRNLKSDEYHPCPYPAELVYRITKYLTYRNDLCADIFNGSGTSTYVWALLGRRYIGIDNSQKYCGMAERRVGALKGAGPAEIAEAIKRIRFQVQDGYRKDGWGRRVSSGKVITE